MSREYRFGIASLFVVTTLLAFVCVAIQLQVSWIPLLVIAMIAVVANTP